MKSTDSRGSLRPIQKCYLKIPNLSGKFFPDGKIIFDNLPDQADSKNAVYNEEAIAGRSTPLITYAYSGTRQISITFHFFVSKREDIQKNIQSVRAICSCVYTRDEDTSIGVPFIPPPVCQYKCGDLISNEELCMVLYNYSINHSTDVAWDEETLCPYRIDLSTTWGVVYHSLDLPHQTRILKSGR